MPKPLEPTFGAFAGVRNTVPVERLGPNDLARGVNVDIDDTGKVKSRRGRRIVLPGGSHSLWSQDGIALFVSSGELTQLQADYTAVSIATGLTDDWMAYAKVNDRVYMTNTRVTGVFAAGRVRSWGMVIPAPPSAAVTVGYLRAGIYQYTMTRLRDDGQESGAGLSVRLDLDDNAGLTFSWTPTTGAFAIYLSEPNGEVMKRAAVVDASTGSYTYTGGPRAIELSTQFLDPPPAGQDLTESNGRLFIAKGEFIFPTNALGLEHCDLRDYLALDGTYVRFVAGVPGGVYAGTDLKTYFLPGGRIEEMGLRVVVNAPGVARSVVIADGAKVLGPSAAGQRVAVFTTGLGVYVGTSDGSVTALTWERYTFNPPKTVAAALRTTDTLSQYIVTA